MRISRIRAAQSAAILLAAFSLGACETLEADMDDSYTPVAHYERYPINVEKQPPS